MGLYTAVLPLLILATGFAVFSVLVSSLTGPKRYNRAKLDSYECGIEPTPQPVGGGRFPVKYYITAMLFIIFDIEIVFLYPWAVSSSPDAYVYLAESIRAWPDQRGLAALIADAGWQAPEWRNLSGGIVALHRANG